MTDLTEVATGNSVFPWYYKRNLVHLLRNISRSPETEIEVEIDVLVGITNSNDPMPLLRETLGALGNLRHERSVTALAAQISEIEEALTGERELQHEPDQLRTLLDSSVKSLVRMDSPEARRVVVAHGLKRKSELGPTNRTVPHDAKTGEELSIQSLLFEGIRRYDEFKRAASVLPDGARFQAVGGQPRLPEGETDAVLVKEVWRRASGGESPEECENELPVDRFRVRCMFEHWVGEGVLTAATVSESR